MNYNTMLLKRNLLECTTIFSCTGTFICVLLNYITNISPITGIWFPLYVLTLFIVSLCVSFKFIQWLLRLNKPIKYDLDGIVADYPYLSVLSRMFPQPKKKALDSEVREYDTNELSVISTVLERKLVSSWYVPYISQEIGFPFACKQMLDQMIGKGFQICNKIETKDVFVDITIVLTSHLKEYQKALKRHEKTPDTSIESLYKKSHPIFNVMNRKLQSADHCTNILRIVFKELVPWELWDTPHSELLVRILSKKLDNFMNTTLAEPAWLNDKLLTILKGQKEQIIVEEQKEIKKDNSDKIVTDTKPEMTSTEIESTTEAIKGTPTVSQKVNEDPNTDGEVEKIESIVEEVPVTSTEPVDIKTSPILRQRRGRQGRSEVKIYDRVIEGSVKTWETDIDLQCISLGQDLLASLDGEITLSRLWGQDADTEGSPNPPRRKSPQPLWFGEEETIDVDPLDTSPQKETKKEQSPKPADALLKDLQSTVSQAKNKIGDLQVDHVALDVSCKQYSSDEAAGMMEGLLDFGIAGLKKGLRFTGLSDDSQEKSPSHRAHEKTSPSEARGRPMPEHKDQLGNGREENNVPPLVKQHRVTSQDSVPSQPRPVPRAEAALGPLPDSPEPQYEEAADLSTSIAKLRCLLQQRAETSPRAERAEEVWWESAEETRGRTQQHHSTRPVDTATLADEYDMNMDRNSPNQASNNMQRLDKLFQRTVTGVFNSIKTAVGAEEEDTKPRTLHDWTYVCSSMDVSVGGALSRLVGSRRSCSHVEAALDSLDQLHTAPAGSPHTADDCEEWCGVCGPAWCGAGAVAAAAGLARSHVSHRLATLLVADLAESLLEAWLSELGAWLRTQVFLTFEQLSETNSAFFEPQDTLRELNVDETCAAVLEHTPALLYAFGEETVSDAVKLMISSFTHKQVNCDVIFRVLDLLTGHFNKSAGLRNPSFDNN